MPRDLLKVIEAIEKVIGDENVKFWFGIFTKTTKTSIPYTAPEAMIFRWNEVALALEKAIDMGIINKNARNVESKTDFPWTETVKDIFADRLDYRVFL